MSLCSLVWSEIVAQRSDEYVYRPPLMLNDGWEVSSLEEEGLDVAIITTLTKKIIDNQFKGIHSLLIVKNGKLVHETYFHGYRQDDLHTIFSITKSVTSALIGIAIDKKFIKSENELLLSFFPEYKELQRDPQKQKIRLKHILNLTSGFETNRVSDGFTTPGVFIYSRAF